MDGKHLSLIPGVAAQLNVWDCQVCTDHGRRLTSKMDMGCSNQEILALNRLGRMLY